MNYLVTLISVVISYMFVSFLDKAKQKGLLGSVLCALLINGIVFFDQPEINKIHASHFALGLTWTVLYIYRKDDSPLWPIAASLLSAAGLYRLLEKWW